MYQLYRTALSAAQSCTKPIDQGRTGPGARGGGVLHYGVRRGCAPVLGSFWHENSGIGIYFCKKISVIGVHFHLEFSGIGVYCHTQNSGYGC